MTTAISDSSHLLCSSPLAPAQWSKMSLDNSLYACTISISDRSVCLSIYACWAAMFEFCHLYLLLLAMFAAVDCFLEARGGWKQRWWLWRSPSIVIIIIIIIIVKATLATLFFILIPLRTVAPMMEVDRGRVLLRVDGCVCLFCTQHSIASPCSVLPFLISLDLLAVLSCLFVFTTSLFWKCLLANYWRCSSGGGGDLPILPIPLYP